MAGAGSRPRLGTGGLGAPFPEGDPFPTKLTGSSSPGLAYARVAIAVDRSRPLSSSTPGILNPAIPVTVRTIAFVCPSASERTSPTATFQSRRSVPISDHSVRSHSSYIQA
jgi:hypothetical protein